MGLTPAQQNAANLALLELRQFQRREYLRALGYTFVPGQDEASSGAALKSIGDLSGKLDILEAHLGEAIGGLRSYEAWCDEASTIHDALVYQSGVADDFQAWDVLTAASSQTVTDVGTVGKEVVAPAALGLTVVVALVAVAYILFMVRR